jgi:hypothetical protein
MMLVAESRFRRLNAPQLMRDVHHGLKCVDGAQCVRLSGKAVA